MWTSRNPWLHWGVILGVCLMAYATSLNNQFMLDDHVVLFGENGVENKTIVSLFNARQHLFYRPVGHLFLMLSHRLFGETAFGYHQANLLLFSIIAYLFFRITEILFQDRKLSLLVALLFCLHPIHSMLVNYVTASVISTFLITMQLGFIFFLKYIESHKRSSYVPSLLFFSLALLSHEMSMMFPLYLAAALFFIYKFPVKKVIFLVFPFVALVVVYFIFRLQFFSLQAPMKRSFMLMFGVPGIYSASMANLFSWYFSKLVWPTNILFLWTDIKFPINDYWGMLQIVLVTVIIIYLLFWRIKKELVAFGVSIFFLGLLPVFWSSFAYYPFAEPMIEPHWFYFSSYGFFLLLAYAFIRIKKFIGSRAVWVVPLVVLVVYFLLLQRHNTVWKDQETYCRYWLKNNDRNMTPFYGMGKSLLDKGAYQKALEYFKKGMDVAPKSTTYIYADIGYAYFLAGDYTRAQQFFVTALKKNWRYSVTHYYLGLMFLKQNQCDQAYKAFLEAKRLYPRDKRYDAYLRITEQCGH